MKNMKTFEGFLDIFKKKRSDDDKIVLEYIKRLEHLKDHLKVGGVSPYEISSNNTDSDDTHEYRRYRFIFDDGAIRIMKAEISSRYRGWNRETQENYIRTGGIKKNEHVFFALFFENADDESSKSDVTLLEKLFELADYCFKRNKENIRINKIKFDMNPSSDLLDNDLYGDTPIDER